MFKFVIPVVYFNMVLHALNSKNDPHPVMDNSHEVDLCVYKGICYLNSYGWFIRLKTDLSLQQFKFKDKWYDVKSFSDDKFSFEIFKIDLGDDDQIQENQKLILLATQEDLKTYLNWVISYAFVSEPVSEQGKISISIQDYNKPLIAISKVERQKNGTLLLGLGDSLGKFYEEMWLVEKDKIIDYSLKNYNYKRELLKSLEYKTDYLKKKVRELNQKREDLIKQLTDLQHKIHGLIAQKELYKKSYLENFSFTSKDNANREKAEKLLENISTIKDINEEIKSYQQEMALKQEEIFPLLIIDKENLWEDHKKELKQEQTELLQGLAEYHSMPDSYEKADENQKNEIRTKINCSFTTFYHGVPDREDHRGIISVMGKNLDLYNNRYNYFQKIVGFTCIKQENEFSEGEKCIAIDLTTQEVRDWISTTIDHYYIQKESASKKKRAADEFNLIHSKRMCLGE